MVSAVADGRFIVAWESGNIIGMPTQDGNNYGVFGRSYDAAGNPSSGEFQINVYTTDHQHTPAVANYGNGSFLAAWYSQDQVMPFPNQDVFARQYRARRRRGRSSWSTCTSNARPVPGRAGCRRGREHRRARGTASARTEA